MAGPLRVEVRVAEGRHLFRAVSRGSGVPEAGDDGSERKKYSATAGAATSGRAPPLLNASLCVGITLGDKHVLTEQCADLQRPVWDKVASFTYDPCPPPADAAAASHEVEPSAAVEMTDMFRAMGLPSRAADPRDQQLPLEPHSGKPSPPAAAAGPQLLSASATAASAPAVDAHARRRALHLRVFSDSLVSKDLLGEVTVDVAALVATGGALLMTDRIGYTDSGGGGGAGGRADEDDGDSSGAFMVPSALAASPPPPLRSHHSKRVSANGTAVAAAAVASAVDFEPLAVDTWVALRQGDGELRVQVLVRLDPSAATAALAAALLRDQSASADALADSTGFMRAAANASPPVQQRLVPAYAGGGGSSSSISSISAGTADVTRLSAAAEAAAAAAAPPAAALPVATSTLEFHDYESDPEHPVETEPMRLQGSTDSNGARGSRRRRARRSELDGEVARLQEYKRHSTAGGGSSSMASANGGGAHAAASRKSSSKGMWRRRRPRPWGALDRAAAAHGDAIVSAPFWLGPLADKLRAVEERYSYSYALAYSQTVVAPGGEAAAAAAAAGTTPTDAAAVAAAALPDTAAAAAAEPAAASWAAAADGAYGAALQRGMLYHCVRVARQREAWARCLVASLELRDAIRAPPPFRALLAPQRGAGGRAGVRVHGAADTPLFDLVLGGIPPSLFGEDCGLGEAEAEGGGGLRRGGSDSGLAFAGDSGDPLSGVKASIPTVEVVRISGHMCCAEYAVAVSAPPRRAWTVLRRYSDFRDLYAALPSAFTAVMAPLPPKSWRSLSHMTMSPEFLEERRMGLEAVLRRLLLQATAMRGDAAEGADVAEQVRAFLGMPRQPESLGGGLLWSVLPELELCLYAEPDAASGGGGGGGGGAFASPSGGLPGGQGAEPRRRGRRSSGGGGGSGSGSGSTTAIHTAEDLRLTMWLVLSGAARAARAAAADGSPGYRALCAADAEARWVDAGGRRREWAAASRHFEAIDVDVNRTYVRSDGEREALRRVLRAFALHLPDVGYCQAMNFVALFLLRTARGREDISFWLLRALACDVAPRYWEGTTSMARLRADLGVLRGLACARMPPLVKRLDDTGLPLELLACDWMLSLFCRVLPPRTVLRVWDWLLLEGADVLVFVALAVLRFAEEDILQVHGACASAYKLNAIAAAIHDADELIDLAVAERDVVLAAHGSLAELRRQQELNEAAAAAQTAAAAAAAAFDSAPEAAAAAAAQDAAARAAAADAAAAAEAEKLAAEAPANVDDGFLGDEDAGMLPATAAAEAAAAVPPPAVVYLAPGAAEGLRHAAAHPALAEPAEATARHHDGSAQGISMPLLPEAVMVTDSFSHNGGHASWLPASSAAPTAAAAAMATAAAALPAAPVSRSGGAQNLRYTQPPHPLLPSMTATAAEIVPSYAADDRNPWTVPAAMVPQAAAASGNRARPGPSTNSHPQPSAYDEPGRFSARASPPAAAAVPRRDAAVRAGYGARQQRSAFGAPPPPPQQRAWSPDEFPAPQPARLARASNAGTARGRNPFADDPPVSTTAAAAAAFATRAAAAPLAPRRSPVNPFDDAFCAPPQQWEPSPLNPFADP